MSMLKGVTILGDRRRGEVVVSLGGLINKRIPAAKVREWLGQDGVQHVLAELNEALRVAEGR